MPRAGFGFARDNFLGASPQDNTWKSDFGTFMVENRLLPQLERAYRKFSDEYGTNNEDALALRSLGPEVLQRVKDVLAPVADAQPVLLHGGEASGGHEALRPHPDNCPHDRHRTQFPGVPMTPCTAFLRGPYNSDTAVE